MNTSSIKRSGIAYNYPKVGSESESALGEKASGRIAIRDRFQTPPIDSPQRRLGASDAGLSPLAPNSSAASPPPVGQPPVASAQPQPQAATNQQPVPTSTTSAVATAPMPASQSAHAAAENAAQSDRSAFVSDTLSQLLGKNSGLLQQARAAGLKSAGQRGLINSSLAAGAAQKAVYDVALPIAQQDAQTQAASNLSAQEYRQSRGLSEQKYGFDSNLSAQEFGQTRTLNQDQIAAQRETQLRDIESRYGLSRQEAEQQLRAQTQSEQAQSQLSAQQAQQTLGEISARSDAEVKLQQLSAQTQKDLAVFDRDRAVQLAKMEADNRLLLQGSQSAAARYGEMLQQVSSILGNTSLSAEDKRTAVNTLVLYAQNAMDAERAIMSAGGVNVGNGSIPFVSSNGTGIADPGAVIPAKPVVLTDSPKPVFPPATPQQNGSLWGGVGGGKSNNSGSGGGLWAGRPKG